MIEVCVETELEPGMPPEELLENYIC